MLFSSAKSGKKSKKSALDSFVPSDPLTEPAAEAHARSLAADLLALGVFDHAYYAAAAGLSDVTALTSAEHYVSTGIGAGASPHPLIELDHFPAEVRAAIKKPEGVAELIRHLRSDAARDHSWGPLFDPRHEKIAEIDPLVALTSLSEDQPLPSAPDYPGEPPTLGEVRAVLLDFAARHRRQFDVSLPPRRDDWDREGTREWVRRVTAPPYTMPTALVSVIMPVFNRADIVTKAIQSVLSQSHTNLELLVIDDGSTDSTRDVVAAIAEQDPRVRLLTGPHTGVGAARNVGLAEARGEFIAFLDSDNTWTTRFLQLSLTILESSPDAVASHAGLRLHRAQGQIQYRGGDAQLADLQIGNSIDLNVLVARATTVATVGPFDITLRRWVDYDLVLRLAKAGRLTYLPFIGCDYDDKPADGRITHKESLHWQWVVRERNLVDWRAVQAGASSRITTRTSVVVVVAGTLGHTTRSVDRLVSGISDDIEVLIVDNGSRPSIGRRITVRYLREPRVRYLRLPVNNNFATAANYGFSHSTGIRVAFLDSDADPRDGWLESLSRVMTDTGAAGVQALLLNADYTVQHAGYAFYDGVRIPSPLLAGLTIADAEAEGPQGLTAISASAALFDVSVFARVRGFDPLFANGLEDVDFCMRVTNDVGSVASFACAADALVIHERKPSANRHRREPENRRVFLSRWSGATPRDDRRRYSALSFEVPHLAPLHGPAHATVTPVLTRPRRTATDIDGKAVRSFRWAIKTGVPSTRGGDRWGDIPFAADLAQALHARGQQVVIDRHEAWNRGSSYLDEVVLTLRGRHAIPPQPGALNIMWVISRPDLVTIEEVQGYDVVFAASAKWAAWMTERSGKTVEPLLQATAPGRFRPDVEPLADPDDLIFVGGSHGDTYGRAIVGLALQAEAPVGLWGPGWEKFAPPSAVRAGYLNADVLPNAYRSANIVLNDHFADMAQWGFINNRTFDAIACGTPVISDEIDGLELFEGAVVVADSVERMRELVTDRSWMPSPERMLALSQFVRSEHSFAARARRLVEAALSGRDS